MLHKQSISLRSVNNQSSGKEENAEKNVARDNINKNVIHKY